MAARAPRRRREPPPPAGINWPAAISLAIDLGLYALGVAFLVAAARVAS